MPTPPYSPSRIEISIPTPSADGQYWGRYPNGDKPSGLIASASVALQASGGLSTQIEAAASAGILSSASGALTGGGGHPLKWNPGHYMGSAVRTNSTNSALAQKNTEIDTMKASGANVLGWMGKYQWPALQSTVSTAFNLSFIDTDYMRVAYTAGVATGKHMIIEIMVDAFSNTPGAILPAFILNNPAFGAGANGTQNGYWTINGGSGVVVALWRIPLMNAMIALWQAIASHVLPDGFTVDTSPYIEQMMTWEINSPTSADSGGGYTSAAYVTNLHSLVQAHNTAFPHTLGIAENNFCNDAATTLQFQTYLKNNRWGGGGPDMPGYSWLTGQSPFGGSLNKLTWGQQAFTGVTTPTYPAGNPDLRGLMPHSQEVQDPELVGFAGQFAAAPWTPQDIMNSVTNLMSKAANAGGVTHFIWQYIGGSGAAHQDPTSFKNTGTSPGNWGSVLSAINANPIPCTRYSANLP